ncbi:MAG: hypothetical protein CMJ64_07300 [Planctomycetaceae bacterium]|nr:hypothetical protein [Planctomycetaceae bacterium]
MSNLHQQLWEFIYDLLPEDEEIAVRKRISSDPEVARAYSTVKLQTESVERASRFDTEQMEWTRPGESDQVPTPASQPAASSAWRTTANWLVGVAAAGLLCVMSSPLLISDSHRDVHVADNAEATAAPATVAPAPMRTVLVGSSKLNAEAVNTFAVRTTTPDGEPLETDVTVRFYDQKNDLAYEDMSRTDSSGTLSLELPSAFAKKAARIEVAPANASDFLSRPLEVSDAKQLTYLRLDRPLFQPGETVNYRSVTLSRLSFDADSETEVRYVVTGTAGDVLKSSEKIASTTDGVGVSEFALPEDAMDGSYAVVVQSPNDSFSEEWREFEVRRYRAPRFKQKLELAKDSYTNGEMVEAEFLAEYAAGGPIANAELKAEAYFGGEKLAIPEMKTDANGAAKLSFRVPDKLADNRASLSVTITDSNGDETISEDVPINLGKVNVHFYPEGGKLAAGLRNRLYFHSRDPHGEPTHIEGRIVDSADNAVADVATTHEGRGVTSFTPQTDAQYWFAIDKPVGIAQSIELPRADPEQRLVMQTGPGVFAASEPIELKLDTTSAETPLVVAGYCRGAMVGQLSIEKPDYEVAENGVASFAGRLVLAPDAQGVIRITVFDRSVTPMVPIAERLAYRKVRKALQVRLSGVQEKYTPGSSVELQVAVTDEDDSPVAATLGLSVVDDAVLNLGQDKSTRLPTYFHLLTDIADPQDMEDANFYLSSEEGAEQALDLLLGTQGWRRFVEVPSDHFLAARLDDLTDEFRYQQLRASSREEAGLAVIGDAFELPFVAEQQSNPQPAASQTAIIAQPKAKEPPFAVGMVLVVGGAGLLLLLAVLGLARTGLSFKLWVPSGAIAATALAIGLIWTQAPSYPAATAIAFHAASDEAKSEDQTDSERIEEAQLPSDGIDLFAGAESESAAAKGQVELQVQMESAERPAPEPAMQPRRNMAVAAGNAPSAAPSVAELPTSSDPAAPIESASRQRYTIDQPKAVAGGAGKQPKETRDTLIARDVQPGRFVRQYARLLGRSPGSSVTPTESAATIYWEPYVKLDASGTKTITFDLPRRETTYRAIVEAHGSGRLGAAETLIISRSGE